MKWYVPLIWMMVSSLPAHAQYEDTDDLGSAPELQLRVVFYKKVQKEFYKGDSIEVIVMPELPVYPPLKFKNKREVARYNKLIRNVKRTLPYAKLVNRKILETYEELEKQPTKKQRDAYMKKVEKDLKTEYTPVMKKLTYAQGKLLIKLIDRECNQSSFHIVQAFFGSFKAGFYQSFAWLFGASLKKEYDPEYDDRMVERVVRLVESGSI